MSKQPNGDNGNLVPTSSRDLATVAPTNPLVSRGLGDLGDLTILQPITVLAEQSVTSSEDVSQASPSPLSVHLKSLSAAHKMLAKVQAVMAAHGVPLAANEKPGESPAVRSAEKTPGNAGPTNAAKGVADGGVKKEPSAGHLVANTLEMKFAWCPPGTFLMGSCQGTRTFTRLRDTKCYEANR